MDWVYVFCVPEDEATYRTTIAAHSEYQGVHVHTGPLGLHHMRNFIATFFERDAAVLQMDDDIRDIMVMCEDESVVDVNKSSRYKLTSLSCDDALPWISSAFETARGRGARLWGVYPVRNGFFMKDLAPITYDLRFCVGAFWGCWNDPELQLHLEEKEDFERTIRAYEKDQCVVRFNRICVATTYYHTPGGLQARNIDRVKESESSCEWLIEQWPQYCRMYRGKKNGMCEVRLKS